ncbi:MAG: CsgG/HfaB family protein [Spirochaetes bacterium]|nr:CsgG/HfaB family protein [Spirochaetota bacterium]MBU1080260.1 CsgG/HfaB family protein [Spirochaetota bacterium]
MKNAFAAAFAVALLAIGCVSDGPAPAGDAEGEHFGGEPVRLAIFDFEVRSSVQGYEALASDVPAALTEAFLRGGVVRPLERAALEKVVSELELSLGGLVDPGTAAKVGKLAGARFVLLGQASVVGGQVRLSCRVVDVETAEIVYAGSSYGDAEDIFEIEEELADLVEEDFS